MRELFLTKSSCRLERGTMNFHLPLLRLLHSSIGSFPSCRHNKLLHWPLRIMRLSILRYAVNVTDMRNSKINRTDSNSNRFGDRKKKKIFSLRVTFRDTFTLTRNESSLIAIQFKGRFQYTLLSRISKR